MDYTPHRYKNQNGMQPSFKYKSKRALWFNSNFTSDFVLIDNKIYEISFDTNPFEIYKFNRLKVLSYIRDSNQSKPIQVKLKFPLAQSREVVNTDLETYPIIYNNHSGARAMHYNDKYSVRLVPQQIPRFIFRLDDNINNYFNGLFGTITNGEIVKILNTYDSYLIFRSSGSFILDKNLVADILIVGGGGAGGGRHGGGGGGGAVIYLTSQSLNSGNYTITIGSGGTAVAPTANPNYGNNGNDTSISLSGTNIYLAKGGGGGLGFVQSSDGRTGVAGGSGGGGGGYSAGGSAVSTNIPSGVYGFAGGYGNEVGSVNKELWSGGGGGGAGAVGANSGTDANGFCVAGAGGVGKQISITGTATFYGGGGGGGANSTAVSAGSGGLGGGGAGSLTNTTATSGTANTGGGGGGGGYNTAINGSGTAGGGGSGVVIIRFKSTNRIEGITANETLIQTTNASIPVTVNSKYVINYQTPVDLPKGTYESIFSNGSILFRDKKFPRPWGAYFAEDWSGTTLLDSSGNNRHATTAGTITKTSGFGNGANGPITYLTGTTTSSITWPAGSIPTTYTILTLARWNGTTTANYQRIFDGSSGNWFQGHIDIGIGANSKQIGGAFYNVWITTDQPNTSLVPTVTDWVCMIGRNSGTIPNNLLANGIPRGIATGGTSGTLLTINNGTSTNQRSDWAMSVVLIWDSALSDAQMFELNRLIDDYKNTGISLKNGLGLNFDYSYPILKDANNTTINPLVWYQFDNSTNSLLTDSSGNGRTLTASTSSPTFDNTNFIKGNGSVNFLASSSQFLSFQPTINFNQINVNKGISISFWGRFTSNTSSAGGGIFEFGSYGATLNYFILIYRSATSINYYIQNGATATAVSKTDLTYYDSNWRHYVWTISTSGIWNIYVNGVINESNFSGIVIPPFNETTNTNFIGKRGQNTLFTDGNIDDFRIYESVLTATQVSELYNGRIGIYNPPSFMLGVEMEDEKLSLINTISTNNRTDDT